jgi:hypothetical protein
LEKLAADWPLLGPFGLGREFLGEFYATLLCEMRGDLHRNRPKAVVVTFGETSNQSFNLLGSRHMSSVGEVPEAIRADFADSILRHSHRVH